MLKYRREIDGSRAIAVAAVVLYHADFTFRGFTVFKGGFIGVDIFFVISGYLITSIILREMAENKFSFAGFYERRARRILPALFTVMLASIPFAWMYMLPKALKEYAGSVLSGLAFGSNIWFWQEASYWTEPSALKPLLHTWSLSVEEQFYVLFPVALVLIWKFARRYLTSLFVLGFLLSLQLAHSGSVRFPDASFYLLPSRGWELLAGALLAKLELEKGRIGHSVLDATMPAVGLSFIFYAFLFFDDQTRHPSFLTLIPVAGTMLFIWFSKTGEWVTDVLSSKLLVAVGLISYGFYLWHFPIFAFARLKDSSPSHFDKLEWITLSLCLASLTYFLIERPFRNRTKIGRRPFVVSIISVFSMIMAIQAYFYLSNGAELRLSTIAPINYLSDEGNENWKNFVTENGCWECPQCNQSSEYNWWTKYNIHDPANPFGLCTANEIQSSKEKPRTIAVIGDSYASMTLIPGLIKTWGKDNVLQRVVSGYDFSEGNIYENKIVSDINFYRPNIIFLSLCWACDEQSIVNVREFVLRNLDPSVSKIILVGSTPFWGYGSLELPKRVVDNFPENRMRLRPEEITFKVEDELSDMARELNIEFLSVIDTFCEQKECLVKLGDSVETFTSWDYGHFTSVASEYFIEINKDKITELLH